MESSELLALYDQDQRISLEWPGLRREVTEHVVRYIGMDEDHDAFITYAWIDEANADEVIRQEQAYFAQLGHQLEWKLYTHDPLADLKDRLEAAGFEAAEPEAVMVLDLQNAGADLLALSSPAVRQITDPDQIIGVLEVQARVWQEDFSMLAAGLADTLRMLPDQISIYAAYADDVPVSSAWIRYFPGSQFASLWGGSTLPAHRGQGHYSALLAVRAQDAAQRGIHFLTVDASDMSRPILEKHGFQIISWTCEYNWDPAGR